MNLFKMKAKEPEPDYSSYESATYDVVGVTFKNEDGDSRQEILEFLYQSSHGRKAKKVKAELKTYDYKGKPALAVYGDGAQVGNIVAGQVSRVIKLLPKIVASELIIDFFIPEDERDKIIYTAQVVLYM